MSGCGCSRTNINRNKKGNRIKKKQKCNACKYSFTSSTVFVCCPKCGETLTPKKYRRLS